MNFEVNKVREMSENALPKYMNATGAHISTLDLISWVNIMTAAYLSVRTNKELECVCV
jgi:hypothetical protein